MSVREILDRHNVMDYSGWVEDNCPACGKEFIWRHDPNLKHGGAVLGYERKELTCPDCKTEFKLSKSVEADYYW